MLERTAITAVPVWGPTDQWQFFVVIALPIAGTAGIEAVVPTFGRPHVTIAHADLNYLVNGLQSCDHREQTNPHFQRGGP